MPVNAITYQPNAAQLMAAYRPIRFIVVAAARPPFVSCDIYLNEVYYKSMIRTAPESFTNVDSTFSFDIADALQEYMQPDLAAIDNRDVLAAPHMSAKVFCRFRSSSIDANGFTIEEPLKPIQGTKFEAPVSGNGLLSNTFFAINTALQHEDNQNLASHLNAYKQGGWNGNAYPLSHRNKTFFCPDDSDHYPVIFRGDCLSADMVMHYRLKGSNVFAVATALDFNECTAIDYDRVVTGNKLDIHLHAALAAGNSVTVQYKKQADAVWKDAGRFTTQDFFFYVNGSNIAGDYNLRIIHFCSPCLSADPVAKTFTLAGAVINTAFKGMTPFCVQQQFDAPVYALLELRNIVVDDRYFPSNDVRYSRDVTGKADMYIKFFSDAAHLNPLDLVQDGLQVFIKQMQSIHHDFNTFHYNGVIENILKYIVDANGTEIFLATVTTQLHNEQYRPYPTINASTDTIYAYSTYIDDQLSAGNTGLKGWVKLQQYNTATNVPTGVVKNNDAGDPDYIAPFADAASCPAGPDQTSVTYENFLQISKVEFKAGAEFQYAPTSNNTESGEYNYILPIPRNTPVKVTVKAKTLDNTNLSGVLKVHVIYVNTAGVQQNAVYSIPNNVETVLPQIFQNIFNVKISNL